ncbi:MAG: hypothetical protein GWN67_10880 [Phycisphaerae bacterium]|nr:hypothetical protein [Phycisphaerae bacterium]NIP52198.1 hypothetical protein [Phycisphaerae bacterium]NIU56861.1 hypothetical protein [Phycisphaerae bacterium]NIV02400.1 hypothetical protein [Phycisphaerae bacterium]NIV69600.1 hypothetical protein [Phycisphaerae bacterium]
MITFRQLLRDFESRGETNLCSVLEQMYEDALNSWLSQLGEHKGSYMGIPHIKNVESHLDRAAPIEFKQKLSPQEIFVLLSAILLHDIGKLQILKQKESLVLDMYPPPEVHSKYSCLHILQKWAFLRIPNKEFARWIAILACSHCWQKPEPDEKCVFRRTKCSILCVDGPTPYSELDLILDLSHGPVRLKWLATLLRIADEVDNCVSRTVPEHIIEALDETDKKAESSWRKCISEVFFNPDGGCIQLRTPNIESEWHESEWKVEELERASQALKNIDNVLENWKVPLVEMGLNYKKSFVEVSVPLHSLFDAEQLEFLKKKHGTRSFSIEPLLSENLLNRITKAILRLDRAVIDGSPFSWEALAEEARINDIKLVQLAVNRIRSIKHYPKHYRCHKLKDVSKVDIILSSQGWSLNKNVPHKNNISGKKPPIYEKGVIPTGIKKLDELLCPEPVKNNHGFYAPKMDYDKWLSPIVAIEGSTGDGKTTLSLQIAFNLAKMGWACLYYSLEQEPARVLKYLESYKFFDPSDSRSKDNIFNMEEDNNAWYKQTRLAGKLLLPRLTPRPVGNINLSSQVVFERRYLELEKSLKWVKNKTSQSFYFIDSLTAFSHKPLIRSEIHRLFSLFRLAQVPLLITLERQRHWGLTKEETHFNCARYLADNVIRLDSEEKDRYFRQSIEVTKSRYNRRILGKHLMKLKSPHQKATKGFDDRCGVVVYPSIHTHLVRSRRKKRFPKSLRLDIPAQVLPVGYITKHPKTQEIDPDTCIVISGPHGGHKFALAVNLLLRTKSPEKTHKIKRKLILSLAEEREIRLRGVALIENMKDWRNSLKELEFSQAQQVEEVKVWEQLFGFADKNKTKERIYISLLNFRMGQIMPEEFLYIFEKYLQNNNIGAVLFTDTAQLRTRFPFLAAEPLFLPALIDIIKSKGLPSVFIDTKDNNRSNQALLAAADCRIFIEHDPKGGNILRSDNVRAKNYDRRERVIDVETDSKLQLSVLKICLKG